MVYLVAVHCKQCFEKLGSVPLLSGTSIPKVLCKKCGGPGLALNEASDEISNWVSLIAVYVFGVVFLGIATFLFATHYGLGSLACLVIGGLLLTAGEKLRRKMTENGQDEATSVGLENRSKIG